MEANNDTYINSNVESHIFKSTLDADAIRDTEKWADEYYKSLESYTSSEEKTPELMDNLKNATEPILTVRKLFESAEVLPPVAAMISEQGKDPQPRHIEEQENEINDPQAYQMEEQENELERKREHKKRATNGFANYVIVLFFTAILGIMLGALLYFIQN